MRAALGRVRDGSAVTTDAGLRSAAAAKRPTREGIDISAPGQGTRSSWRAALRMGFRESRYEPPISQLRLALVLNSYYTETCTAAAEQPSSSSASAPAAPPPPFTAKKSAPPAPSGYSAFGPQRSLAAGSSPYAGVFDGAPIALDTLAIRCSCVAAACSSSDYLSSNLISYRTSPEARSKEACCSHPDCCSWLHVLQSNRGGWERGLRCSEWV